MLYKAHKEMKLSMLGMGNMRLPKAEDGKIDYDHAKSIIDYAMANGVNYFDTAYVYHGGESEVFLGKALKEYSRESYHLATKFFVSADPNYQAVFEEQLSRLQTDYIDFYMLHGIFDTTVDAYLDGGCVEYFLEQKAKGRIKNLGFSFHASMETLEKVIRAGKWDFAQIQLNYLDWDFIDAKDLYLRLKEEEIPMIIMEPLHGGELAVLPEEATALLKKAHADWTPVEWAFRWLLRYEGIQVILSGMSTLEQMQENVAIFNSAQALSDADAALLDQVCQILRSKMAVPCTGCRYCCDNCPQQLDIPMLLKAYNNYKADGERGIRTFGGLAEEQKPSMCIGCGLCAEHCPQQIDIPGALAELAEGMKNAKQFLRA